MHDHGDVVELRQLHYFVAVAETLHFRRAAERLALTQPALSHQIIQLEHELGVRLFDRDRRHVELTTAGLVLLDRARPLLAQCAQALAATRWAGGITGHALRAAYPRYAERVVRPLLDALRAHHPDIWVADQRMVSAEATAGLADGSLDAAFVPPSTDRDLAWSSLQPGELVVWLPAAHPLAASDQVPLRRLADEPLLVPAPLVAPGYRAMLTWISQLGEFRLKLLTLEASTPRTPAALAGLVAAGQGVLLVPRGAPVPAAEIRVRKVVLPVIRGLELGLARPRQQPTAPVQALVALLADNQPFGPPPAMPPSSRRGRTR